MPIASFSDLARLSTGNPHFVEQITTSTSPAYSIEVFNTGQMVRLIAETEDAFVRFVRDYVYMGKFGDNRYEEPLKVWVTDDEDANLKAGTPWSTSLTTSSITLNKTSPGAGDRDLKFPLEDQDDELSVILNARPRARAGAVELRQMPASDNFVLDVRHRNLIEIVTGVNDKLDFTEGTTGAAVATLDAGVYTRAALATEIQTQMDAAATDNTYTVDFDSTASDKFSIVRATGTDTIALDWNSGPNSATSVGTTIGFDVSADDSGSTTYSADNTRAIADGLQYLVTYENAAGTDRHWTGSAWQDAANWIDLTGVESIGSATDDVDTEEAAVYTVKFRPKADTPGGVVFIDSVGFYEEQQNLDGARMQVDREEMFAPPFRCRVAADAAGAGNLRIDEMRQD